MVLVPTHESVQTQPLWVKQVSEVWYVLHSDGTPEQLDVELNHSQPLSAAHVSAVVCVEQDVAVPPHVPPHVQRAASQALWVATVEQAATVPRQAWTPESGPPRWHQPCESQMVPSTQSSFDSQITTQSFTPLQVV